MEPRQVEISLCSAEGVKMEQLKIILFTVGFGGGGAERIFVNLANHWASLGHEVEFWVIKHVGPRAKDLNDGIPIRELGCGSRVLQRFSLPIKLRKMLASAEPDRVFSTLTYANCLLGAALRGLKQRPMCIFREANSFANQRKRGALDYWSSLLWMRRTYPFASAIIANAPNMVDEVKAYVIRSGKTPVVYIPNPVPLEPVDGSVLPVVRAKEGIKRVLGCGRLIPQKGFDLLIRAMAELPASLTWELVLLGDGPERTRLEALVDSLGIRERVSFPGFVEDVRQWMRGADLFVLSSRWEGFPNVLVEAMACDTPVIGTACPGAVSEILSGELAEFQVPVDDRLALSLKIRELLAMPPKPKVIQSKIERDYAFEVISQEYLDLSHV